MTKNQQLNYCEIKANQQPKEELAIVRTLDRFNEHLDELANQFVVIGGANMVLRGLKRATTDIDLLVSDDVFRVTHSFIGAKLIKPPKRALEAGATNQSIHIDTKWTELPICLTTSMGDGYFPISYKKYDGEDGGVELRKGFRCSPIEDIWQSKQALNRFKDTEDLKTLSFVLGINDNPFVPTPYNDEVGF